MSEILNNEAVAELEKRIDSFPLSPHQARALCATVKDLRRERDEAIKARDLYVSLKRGQQERADEIEARALELLQERNDLQSQLEQLRAENEALKDKYRSADVHVAALLNARCGSGPTHLGIEHSLSIIDQQFDENRACAIQLCKDKAAEWKAQINKELAGLTAGKYVGKAEAAKELATELEKL